MSFASQFQTTRLFNYSYIFSLALADLLVIIICVPLAIMVYTTESSPMGSTLCRLTEFAKDISVGVSVFTLTALSGERYCAIVNPLRKLHVSGESSVSLGLSVNPHKLPLISIHFTDKAADRLYGRHDLAAGDNLRAARGHPVR